MKCFNPVTLLWRSPSQTAGTEACKISSSGKNTRAFCEAQTQGNRSLQALQSSTKPSWPLSRDCECALRSTTRARHSPGSTARSRATQHLTEISASLISRHTRQAPSRRRSTPSLISASQELAPLFPVAESTAPAPMLMNSWWRTPNHRVPVLVPATHPARRQLLPSNVVESTTRRRRTIQPSTRIPLVPAPSTPSSPSLPLRQRQAPQSSLSTTCRLASTTSASR